MRTDELLERLAEINGYDDDLHDQVAAEIRRLSGLVEDLKRCVVEEAIPLEAMIIAGRPAWMSEAMWEGVVNGAKAARATLAKLKPKGEGEAHG